MRNNFLEWSIRVVDDDGVGETVCNGTTDSVDVNVADAIVSVTTEPALFESFTVTFVVVGAGAGDGIIAAVTSTAVADGGVGDIGSGKSDDVDEVDEVVGDDVNRTIDAGTDWLRLTLPFENPTHPSVRRKNER